MVKMTKNSDMGGLLEPIKNSATWKSVLREAVLHVQPVSKFAGLKTEFKRTRSFEDCKEKLFSIFI